MKAVYVLILCCFQTLFAQKEIKHVVYFETDKYTISETEMHRLQLFIDEVESIDINKISIYGFCDDRGSHSYNLTLSQNRADSIKDVFMTNEFDQSLITNVDGKGEKLLKIINDNNINKARGLNRKVEIIVQPVYPPRKNNFDSTALENILKSDLKVGDKIVLENILFVRGYKYPIPESKKILTKVADILAKRPDIYFTIEGHVCCTNGTRDAVNAQTRKRDLSYARAKYVYEFFIKKRINKRRMKYVGMKRRFPLGGEQRFDRRVELLVTKIGN